MRELEGVPQKSLTSLEEHCRYRRIVTWLRVAQINSRLSLIPLHWLQSNSLFPIIYDKWLDFLYPMTEIPGDTRLKSVGTPISAQELEESSMHPISSREES